jgi:hypothetical protein
MSVGISLIFLRPYALFFTGESSKIKIIYRLVTVAHIYNPSYSNGRDWEDCSLRTSWAKIS